MVETAAHWPSVDTLEIIFVAPLIIVYKEYDFIPIPIPELLLLFTDNTILYIQGDSPRMLTPIFIKKINFSKF